MRECVFTNGRVDAVYRLKNGRVGPRCRRYVFNKSKFCALDVVVRARMGWVRSAPADRKQSQPCNYTRPVDKTSTRVGNSRYFSASVCRSYNWLPAFVFGCHVFFFPLRTNSYAVVFYIHTLTFQRNPHWHVHTRRRVGVIGRVPAFINTPAVVMKSYFRI